MTATCSLFGATAAIGSVTGADADAVEAALWVNGSQSVESLQFLENGGWNERFHPGVGRPLVGRCRRAHSSVVAAALAKSGFAAAASPIGGVRSFPQGCSGNPHPERATEGPGREYEVLRTGLEPYPCCRHMHNPLGQLLALAEEHEIDQASVESVTV